MKSEPHKSAYLSRRNLTAIVFGSIIGSGIYDIPQNMAEGAALGAVLLSWLISGVGILFLVLTFKILADNRPELNAGVYQYALAGFGRYAGFNMAWGSWLCMAFGNIAFAVMLNDAFGEFYPVLLEHGWQTVVFGLVFIWLMYGLLSVGMRFASVLNTVVTAVKFISLLFIIILMLVFFKVGALDVDFWGKLPDLGSLAKQVRSTMLVTLWCFMGVEGAVVLASRAKDSRDVGKAGLTGFLLALLLYILITVLSFGILHQSELAVLGDPSVAYILKDALGEWAYTFVIISVMIAVIGGWIAWTIMCAQVPYMAARVGLLPRSFLRENKKGTPTHALLVSTVIMSVFMLIVVTAKSVYLAAVDVTSVMILPAYLFCGLYLVKLSFKRNGLGAYPAEQIYYPRTIGICASLYCLWLIYAGGFDLLLVTSLFYVAGLSFFIIARQQQKKIGEKIFKPAEIAVVLLLGICSVISIFLIVAKKVAL